MKKVLFTCLFICLLFSYAAAGEMNGKSFVVGDYILSFQEDSTFSPARGTATLQYLSDSVDLDYVESLPVISLHWGDYWMKFIYVDGQLWYLDPSGMTLSEQ